MEQTAFLEKDRYKKQDKKGGDNFASNNNNPFLVSPYSPVNLGAFATNNVVNEISSIVSSIFGDLNAVIDVATFTLSISTIKPVASDVSRTITLDATNVRIANNLQIS